MFGGLLRIVVLIATGALLASCDAFDRLFPSSIPGYFGGHSLRHFTASDGTSPGTIQRTISSSSFSSLTDILPICSADTKVLSPAVQSKGLPDVNKTLTPAQALGSVQFGYLGSTIPDVARFVKSVHIQMTGVTRLFIEDSEVLRIHQRLWPSCRNLMNQHLANGHSVFMVQSVISAKKIKITLDFIPGALPVGFLPEKVTVNGLASPTRDGLKSVYKGADLIFEVSYKTFGDQ